MKTTVYLLLLLFSRSLCGAQIASINIIDIHATVMEQTPLLFGITFDARTSLIGNGSVGLIGYYNTDGTVIPAVDSLFHDFPMSTVRYPGNGIATGFDWKKSIGPGPRPKQSLMGGIGPPQPVNFGFDEFMAMTAARGVTPENIQIMVPIYDSAASGLTPIQANAALADVIASNADWVEYCNAPDDGSNPGGGVDWAARRTANGHPLPYGVKIWNIGNEPWSSQEFGSSNISCASYLATVTPIIDAMLAIDPTIKITLPTTGNPGNAANWSNALLNSALVAQGKVYALSQHYFPTEATTSGAAPSRGVSAVRSNLNTLVNAAASKGVKVFVGDYAHFIVSQNPTAAQRDSAMQWLAANFEADFLLMLSQESSIERANFWVYGNAQAVWHPLRYDAVNQYTLMPAAEIYQRLFPAFLNHSVRVASTSPEASDRNPYAVRSNAFVSNDLEKMNVVAVNRDRTATVTLQVGGTGGYALLHARELTADSFTSETITESPAVADAAGNYRMPPMSVLILEHSRISAGTGEKTTERNGNFLYPNPASSCIRFQAMQDEIEVFNALGQVVIPTRQNVQTISTAHLENGVYFVKAGNTTHTFLVKH